MTGFPRAPRTLQGGFVLMDADGKQALRTVVFQYNPDTLSRQLSPRSAKVDSGDRLEALRLTGPPVETLKLEVEFDATDKLGQAVPEPDTVENGIAADLAAFETILSPATGDLEAAVARANTGTLEILPEAAPLVLLVLGKNRVLPVRITDVSVIEEQFDARLNPVRARISLGLRLLSSEDMAPGTKGAELYMAAARRRERLAANRPGSLLTLGLSAQP